MHTFGFLINVLHFLLHFHLRYDAPIRFLFFPFVFHRTLLTTENVFRSDYMHVRVRGSSVTSLRLTKRYTVKYHARISFPHPPPPKKCFVLKRAYLRNHERSCVLFFKILLRYQFFLEMLKQVRGSVNDYENTLV